jgi:hypothetical protein
MGGYGPSGAVGAWIFDPSTQQMVALLMPTTEARVGHSATLLPDGTVLIVGGRNAAVSLLATAHRFDPDGGIFSPVAC